MQRIKTREAPAPIGPYSQAVIHNHTVYVSGQIGMNPKTGELLSENLESETRQAMKNLMAVITAAGSNPDKVIKCTLFVLDMKAFKTINEVYGSFFRETFPARETVQVSALPAGASVEISAIAAV